MKTFPHLLFACTILASPAVAGTFKIPDADSPIAKVTIPDNWKPSETNNGVQGTSPDDEVYVSVEAVGSEKGMNSVLDETFKMLKDSKVTFDKATEKKTEFKLNGYDATELQYVGKMEGEAQQISIVLVIIKDKVVVITYWASDKGDKDKKDSDAIGNIVNSIKGV